MRHLHARLTALTVPVDDPTVHDPPRRLIVAAFAIGMLLSTLV